MKFYRCSTCKKILTIINDGYENIPTICCNKNMEELIPNSSETNLFEKHIPEVTRKDSFITVKIGNILHPSIKTHYIEWVAIETNKGFSIKKLTHDENPIVTFSLTDDENIIHVYSYCNLHGLFVL